MSFKTDFLNYRDGNNLLAPNPVTPGAIRASDNGTMFLSEYIIMMARNKLLTEQDKIDYLNTINTCVGEDKELHRAPGDTAPDEVDDHYAVYAAHVELGLVPRFKLPFRLWRQPQLLFASICADNRVTLIHLPLAIISALVIATSCISVEVNDTDSG